MKMELRIGRHGSSLFKGTYDVTDAESFGRACADAWTQIRTKRLDEASSVGALMDLLNQNVLEELQDAEITLRKRQGPDLPRAGGTLRQSKKGAGAPE